MNKKSNMFRARNIFSSKLAIVATLTDRQILKHFQAPTEIQTGEPNSPTFPIHISSAWNLGTEDSTISKRDINLSAARWLMLSLRWFQCLRKEIYILSIFDKAVGSFLAIFLSRFSGIEVCLPFQLWEELRLTSLTACFISVRLEYLPRQLH